MKGIMGNGHSSAGHASLLPGLDFSALELRSAFDLEMTGREFLASLRAVRCQFETPERSQEFDRLCDGIEAWLHREMSGIRLGNTAQSETALDC